MSTFDWPDSRPFRWSNTSTLQVIDNSQKVSESPLTGDIQTVSMPGARWGWDIQIAGHDATERAHVEGWLIGLSGRQHRVRTWDRFRPRPLGTINTVGVVLGSSANRFAEQLVLSGCGANTTLLAGDWLSLGGQLLMCVADAVANAGGVMTANVRHMLRSPANAGAPVTLEKPTSLFVRTESGLSLMRDAGHTQSPISISLVEVFL